MQDRQTGRQMDGSESDRQTSECCLPLHTYAIIAGELMLVIYFF